MAAQAYLFQWRYTHLQGLWPDHRGPLWVLPWLSSLRLNEGSDLAVRTCTCTDIHIQVHVPTLRYPYPRTSMPPSPTHTHPYPYRPTSGCSKRFSCCSFGENFQLSLKPSSSHLNCIKGRIWGWYKHNSGYIHVLHGVLTAYLWSGSNWWQCLPQIPPLHSVSLGLHEGNEDLSAHLCKHGHKCTHSHTDTHTKDGHKKAHTQTYTDRHKHTHTSGNDLPSSSQSIFR